MNFYYYLYYKLYKLAEAAPFRWLSEWKASLFLDALVFFTMISAMNYYSFIFNVDIVIEDPHFFVIISYYLICLPNFFMFNFNNQWKKIVKKNDALPPKLQNTKGIIAWITIFLILTNLIFSFKLLYLKAEKDHTGPYSVEYLKQQKSK